MERRRLLVIANSFPDKADAHPGGIFVKEQVRSLAPHFEEVHVVFPSTLGLSFKPRDDFKDYSFGNVHVHFLSYFNIPLFLRVFRRGFTYLMARGVDRLIRREGIRFDLIHAHFTWPSGGAAVRLREKYKVPVVVTEHTSIAFNAAIATKDPQFLETWFASDAIIRVKDDDIERMAAAGVPREKLHFIPNGFDDAKFRPIDQGDSRKRLGLPQGGKVIVCIGALLEVKGHRYLIEAMAEVLKTTEDVSCYIIGDGELLHTLTKMAEEKGVGDKVKFVGSKPHGELPFWISASDAVVHSSLSESGPMVMFEALGSGRPFIGTRVGSIPGVIASEDYGLVCEPGDPAALARNIVTALGRSWDSDRIVAHSRQYASEWVSRQLVELYARLLEKD